MSSTVTRELNVQVVAPVDGASEVCVSMRYHTADPYAVHAVFLVAPEQEVSWVFARDLLTQGLDRPAGEGDVRIWPDSHEGHPVVCISLSSPDGAALLQAGSAELVEFMSASYALCPPGREGQHLDLDSALGAFFAS